ncbi:MAG TPA: DUF2339 domain-containing protein, partial [Polyangiaceae bacterium]|nr:DUF2339 domain-containing protein [Polyangiaceae bacterium]
VARAPALATGSLVSLAAVLGLGGALQLDAGGPAPSLAAFAAGGLAIAAAFGFARVRPDDPFTPSLAAAARWASLVFLVALALHARALPAFAVAALAGALTLIILCTPGAVPLGYPALGLLLATIVTVEAWATPRPGAAEILFGGGALALLFLAVPFAARRELLESPSLPRGHALAIASFGLALGSPFLFDHDIDVGITLAGVGGAAALSFAATRAFARGEAARRASALSVGLLALVSFDLAVAFGLEREWVAYGLSALGLALIGLRGRVGGERLGAIGVAHLALAAARVVANPGLLGYHPRGELPVLNWIAPAFLVPAAACAIGWRALAAGAEGTPPTGAGKGLRALPGALALVLLFGWANVAAIDAFASGPAVSFETDAPQARDLAMSLVWAAFGVGLLVLGMRRGSGALRSASLVLMVATAGKAFLYDLSQLEDLYRVASLVALAGSLLGISVLYQRYVFAAGGARGRAAAGAGGGGPPEGAPR